MKRFLKAGFTLACCLFPSLVFGDTITLSGNPSTLTINSATAGSQPNNATNASTTYSVSTSNTVRAINGKLSANMPTNVTLQVSLVAPTGATSLGSVTMTTVAANLVTGIPINTVASAKTVTYTLSATAAAAQVSNATKTLTLTLQ